MSREECDGLTESKIRYMVVFTLMRGKRTFGPPVKFFAHPSNLDPPARKLINHMETCHGGKFDPECNACKELERKIK